MKYFEIAPVKIVRADNAILTYQSDMDLHPGQLVEVPVGKKTMVGLVMAQTQQPRYRTKDILSIIEPTPLPKSFIPLVKWIAEYYDTHLATVLQTVLPRGVEKNRRPAKKQPTTSVRNRTNILFNKEQLQALDKIFSDPQGTILLQGVTGSGKTEIYKEVARRLKDNGESTIILVPEIGLTSQLVDELSQDFPDAILTHSQMSESSRHQIWLEVLNSDKPQVIIGPRSALFMPIHKLGAIIVDEAHEPSYKQEQAPRYSALRVASVLGAFSKAKVIFGSATPLVVDRFVAEQQFVPIVKLDHRARSDAKPAKVQIVDMTKRSENGSHPFLSRQLTKSIDAALANNEQVLLFHNRRGSAGTTLCASCGWTATCPNCFVPLILHEDKFALSCHICNHQTKIPQTCPDCGSGDIMHRGVGTKRIETELQRLYPTANIARFDSDNAREQTVQARYADLYKGNIDLIIGTQMVAKGLDLPKLNTVGVIQADSGLALPDYMAEERVFQLIAQVVGRVGRDKRQTKVILQTYRPDSPAITYGAQQDYESFYKYALKKRAQSDFPPYRYLLKLTAVYKTEDGAIRASQKLARDL